MTPRKLKFNVTQMTQLRELGVTDEQMRLLEYKLPLIRIDIEGHAPNTEIREALKRVHDALVKAEAEVQKMLTKSGPARAQAWGALASGAASVVPLHAVAGIESATEGAVPELVDVPTLLCLLVLAAERGLEEVPSGKYAKPAPARSIGRIVEALNRPEDAASRHAADALKPSRSREVFVGLCECVLEAANGGQGVPVDRAIREFLSTHKFNAPSRRWYLR